MIIGNGLIAKNCFFIDQEDILFFASGVSNSMCNDDNEYRKEITLLEKYIKTDKKIIYFSSIDEYIVNNKYLKHKKHIEEIIKSNTDNFIILKLPQLVGESGNSKNFISYIYNNIKNNIEFDVFLTKRSLLDIFDLINFLKHLIKKDFRGFININYIELSEVTDIVEIIEGILNKKAIIKKNIIIDQKINKNNEFVDSLINKVIKNTEFYNLKTIKKYFNEKN